MHQRCDLPGFAQPPLGSSRRFCALSVFAGCLDAPLKSTGSRLLFFGSQGWRRVSELTGLGRWVLSQEINQSRRRDSFEGGEDLPVKCVSTCARSRSCGQRESPLIGTRAWPLVHGGEGSGQNRKEDWSEESTLQAESPRAVGISPESLGLKEHICSS